MEKNWTMGRPLLLLALLTTALAATSALGRRGVLLGGWNPVPDVNDPHVQELGGWAVAQHASLTNDGLLFRRVTRGEQQVVSGMNYRLFVVAADGSGRRVTYLAQTYEHWSSTCKLTSFKPAPAAGG